MAFLTPVDTSGISNHTRLTGTASSSARGKWGTSPVRFADVVQRFLDVVRCCQNASSLASFPLRYTSPL